MNYQETLDLLFAQLPMYQRSGAAAYKNDLAATEALDAYFGFPHRAYKNVHVAGTNGKGTVSCMLASILKEAGYKTGLYTSPHYVDFRERIRINGEMISEHKVIEFTEKFFPQLKHISPSFFEMTFAMACWHFREQKIDVAVWETGMGGRLDSTNVVKPEVSAITNISLDHVRFLGESVTAIAGEKAGIIKENVSIVIGEWQEDAAQVFKHRATEKNAPITWASDEIEFAMAEILSDGLRIAIKDEKLVSGAFTVPLPASYQFLNVKTTLQVIKKLREKGFKISSDAIKKGFANIFQNAGYKGRFQILGKKPLIIADSAHNPAGIRLVMDQIREMSAEKLHFVIGMVNDKDIKSVLELMPAGAEYYFAKADIPRGLAARELRRFAEASGLKGKDYDSVNAALKAAKAAASEKDLIFIGGSTFTVAEVVW